jgi:hypothetical protein
VLFDQMLAFLDREGVPYQIHDERNAVRVDHEGQRVEWACIVQVWEDERVLVCYSVSPVRPTGDTITATSEFVHRANIGLLVGNFELDLDDGEIRFKTSVGFGPRGEWSDELARVVFYTNLASMEHYVVSLLGVVTGASTAREALAEVE